MAGCCSKLDPDTLYSSVHMLFTPTSILGNGHFFVDLIVLFVAAHYCCYYIGTWNGIDIEYDLRASHAQYSSPVYRISKWICMILQYKTRQNKTLPQILHYLPRLKFFVLPLYTPWLQSYLIQRWFSGDTSYTRGRSDSCAISAINLGEKHRAPAPR